MTTCTWLLYMWMSCAAPNCDLIFMTILKACIIAVWFRLGSGHLLVWFRLGMALCSVGPMCYQVLHVCLETV